MESDCETSLQLVKAVKLLSGGATERISKLVEVVTVVDVSDEDRVGNSLLQIWKLRFGHKA